MNVIHFFEQYKGHFRHGGLRSLYIKKDGTQFLTCVDATGAETRIQKKRIKIRNIIERIEK